MSSLLAISLAIAAGLLFSRIARLLHLPNVTGYLVAGLAIGPYVLGLLPLEVVESMGVITTVALGFIAYAIGGEFRLSYLKEIGSKPVTITVWQGMMAVALVDIGLIALGFPLPLCLVMGAIATATAPAATLMVVRQYKAKGTVSDMLLPVVAMDDALGLMVFSISAAIAKALSSGSAITWNNMLVEPLVEIIASLALGVVLGLVLVFFSKYFKSRGNKLALTIMCVFAAVGLCDMWGLSSLLVCMMMGAAMVNLSKQSDVLLEQCDRFTPPLFLLFFVLSGADLNLTVLPTIGLLGFAYLLLRSFGKWMGASLGARAVRADHNVCKYLGLTLLPQAGVAIGMARLAVGILPEYGAQINAVVLSATLIYELVGPVITKIALTKAGEIQPGENTTALPAAQMADGKGA